jgi:sugar/nucleoside kinase (ribokinase family)
MIKAPEKIKETRVVVCGDLCVDYIIALEKWDENMIISRPYPGNMGGTGYNASLCFRDAGIVPILSGSVGGDREGQCILESVKKQNIPSFLTKQETKSTGVCEIIYQDDKRLLIQNDDENTANDYNPETLRQTIKQYNIQSHDFIFVATHSLSRFSIDHAKKFFEAVYDSGARVVVDAVPHDLYKNIKISDFCAVVQKPDVLIGELNTFMRLTGRSSDNINEQYVPSHEDIRAFYTAINTNILDVRFGIGNISRQWILRREGKKIAVVEQNHTGYESIQDKHERRAFGDRLTASVITQYGLLKTKTPLYEIPL